MTRRVLSTVFLAFLVVVCLVAGRTATAQQPATPQDAPPPASSDAPPPSYETPPAITLVDGTARLVRQGQSQSAVASMPLIEGDRIVTENGRVAVTFPDGTLLHIDQNTSIDFLSMSLMRMLDGRVILAVAGRGGERAAVDYQIDAPAGSVRVQTAGEYKLATLTRDVELDVITGSASLATDQGSVQVEAGERSFASEGDAPSAPEAFNSARLDAFDQWSDSQREATNEDTAGRSAEYLPSDLYAYSDTFDRYGRWQNDPSYGNVWYPTVSVGWRPYYNGYWDYVGPYGWTWIGYDRWAWPTHHFGRWGFRAGLWFWIPQRHWGPAWVSWAYSPGYYGWCPLDFYNRPLVSFFFGSRFGFHGSFDPWLCWTVLPRHRFGPGYRVASYAVLGSRLSETARSAFVVRRGGPERPLGFARQGASPRFGGDARGTATPRALTSVGMQARPRDGVFGGARTTLRNGVAAAPMTTPRADRRSLPYSAPGQRYERGGSYPGAVAPRSSLRQSAPSESRSPASRVAPRGFDRPSAPNSQPRAYSSSPYRDRPPASGSRTPGAAPRDLTPMRPRGDSSAAPRYAPPSRTESPRYSAPRYSAPAAPRSTAPASPRYSAPPRAESPRYSAPSAPRYSPAPRSEAPRYSAPAAPRSAPQYSRPSYSAPQYSRPSYSAPAPSPRSYSGPSAPRYSAPSYSAPRSAPSAGPRTGGGGGGAPRSAPPASGPSRSRGGRGR